MLRVLKRKGCLQETSLKVAPPHVHIHRQSVLTGWTISCKPYIHQFCSQKVKQSLYWVTARAVPEVPPPHELIHEQPVPAVGAVAQEAQQVWVGQPLGDSADLCQELRLALLALHAQPLHRNLREKG
jgi:hypothetical protein